MTIAKHLEHTLLKPEATVEDIMQLCSEARKYGLFGVCVNPCYVGLARHQRALRPPFLSPEP